MMFCMSRFSLNLFTSVSGLSKDSGIPQKTLWRWWNEEEKRKDENLKNQISEEGGTISGDSYKNNEIEMAETVEVEASLCIRCG